MLYGPGDVELCAWDPGDAAASAVAAPEAPSIVPADWLLRVPTVNGNASVALAPVPLAVAAGATRVRPVLMAA